MLYGKRCSFFVKEEKLVFQFASKDDRDHMTEEDNYRLRFFLQHEILPFVYPNWYAKIKTITFSWLSEDGAKRSQHDKIARLKYVMDTKDQTVRQYVENHVNLDVDTLIVIDFPDRERAVTTHWPSGDFSVAPLIADSGSAVVRRDADAGGVCAEIYSSYRDYPGFAMNFNPVRVYDDHEEMCQLYKSAALEARSEELQALCDELLLYYTGDGYNFVYNEMDSLMSAIFTVSKAVQDHASVKECIGKVQKYNTILQSDTNDNSLGVYRYMVNVFKHSQEFDIGMMSSQVLANPGLDDLRTPNFIVNFFMSGSRKYSERHFIQETVNLCTGANQTDETRSVGLLVFAVITKKAFLLMSSEVPPGENIMLWRKTHIDVEHLPKGASRRTLGIVSASSSKHMHEGPGRIQKADVHYFGMHSFCLILSPGCRFLPVSEGSTEHGDIEKEVIVLDAIKLAEVPGTTFTCCVLGGKSLRKIAWGMDEHMHLRPETKLLRF